jgi:succinoglycan biosynthesis transport protein ExoP
LTDRPAGQDGFREEHGESLTWEHIRRFAEAPLRRPLMVLVPWVTIFALSVAALFLLPKKYRSSTLILVESEKVPDSFVTRVATQDTRARLEAIWPEVLSRTRLERVLADTRPYPDITSSMLALETIRKAIAVNLSGTDGFTIEFVHTDPHKAQEVADRIATLFIDETIKSRGQQVEDAVDFLDAQVSGARKGLETKDEALRRFKEQRMGTLPEQLQTNLATLSMLQRELQTTQESLIFARERQESLARSFGRASTGVTRTGEPSSADSELTELRRQLAALKDRYTDEHPDIQSLTGRIARLQQRRSETTGEDPTVPGVDPSTLVAREQLARATAEVKSLEQTRADLDLRVDALRNRVEETPRTEQELSTLTRDYDQLRENYTTLLRKQLEAQMAGRLEQRWKGERFRVLDPASLPEKPSFPKPIIVLGLGAVLGLLFGLGACLAVELLDPTFKDVGDLSSLGSYPVLGRIPHLPTLGDRVTR